jgi:hypothetical protein
VKKRGIRRFHYPDLRRLIDEADQSFARSDASKIDRQAENPSASERLGSCIYTVIVE